MSMCVKTLVILYAWVYFLAGCSMSTSVTRVGSDTFPPLPQTAEVLVFSNEHEIQTSYIPLGIVHTSATPGTVFSSPYTVDDVIDALKSKAREVGANDLIMDESHATGQLGKGLEVRARAVRLPEKLPRVP